MKGSQDEKTVKEGRMKENRDRKEMDKRIGRVLQESIREIPWSEQQEREGLRAVHAAMEERRMKMRFQGRKMVAAAAVILALTGTITAAAAGKITGLFSSTNKTDAVTSAGELEEKGKKEVGEELFVADALADGSRFQEGYVTEIQAVDDGGNTVGTYPEISIQYGDYFFSVIRESDREIMDGNQKDASAADYEEWYEGICLTGREDDYLFLPPDQKPSEEDKSREGAGELYISYGAEKEERCVYKNMMWEKDGLSYTMVTSADKTLEEMAELAKAYMDSER